MAAVSHVRTAQSTNELPDIRTLTAEPLNQFDIVAIQEIARFNNVVLHFIDRGKTPDNSGFEIRKRRQSGIEYTTIRAAKDLTAEEYAKLTFEIDPAYEGKPIEEILVSEGFKSLLHIIDAQLRPPKEQEKPKRERLEDLRKTINQTREELAIAVKQQDIGKRAEMQSAALDVLMMSFHRNLPHIDYLGPNPKHFQSPRRTLYQLDAVCEQKAHLAQAVLSTIQPDTGGIFINYGGALVEYRGMGVEHAIALCTLADGGHYLFDANHPQAAGRIPKEVKVKATTYENPQYPSVTEYEIVQKIREEGGTQVTRFHRKLQMQEPKTMITCDQHINLGAIHFLNGRRTQFLRDMETALAINPRHTGAHLQLGAYYYNTGRTADAVRECQTTLEINPRHADAHHYLGKVFSRMGKTDEAVEEFERTLKINPKHPQANKDLGKEYIEKNMPSKGLQHLRAQLTQTPHDKDTLFLLGATCVTEYRSKKPKTEKLLHEAITAFEELLRQKSDFPEARYNLGIAYQIAGRDEDAIMQFRQTIKASPQMVESHYILAGLLAKQGKIPEALKELYTFLQNCPPNKHPELRAEAQAIITENA